MCNRERHCLRIPTRKSSEFEIRTYEVCDCSLRSCQIDRRNTMHTEAFELADILKSCTPPTFYKALARALKET